MPLTKTTSAQAKSSSVAGAMFSSMKRTGQPGGTVAAGERLVDSIRVGADLTVTPGRP